MKSVKYITQWRNPTKKNNKKPSSFLKLKISNRFPIIALITNETENDYRV